MHQDYLSSAVYSSLIKPLPVFSKNGNGSTQCRTNRKSKNPKSAAVEPIIDNEVDCRCPVPDPVGGEEEEEAMAYRESSELHLHEVSRGAHNLTRMIESWSKAPNLDGRSRYIADDLMRGALDLQESLIMLGRLQEASKVMSQRKRRPRVEFMEEREQEFDVESMGSRRFETGGRHTRLQQQRLSVDGALKNSNEDLRKVIRDSLHRQSLLPNSSDDERASSSRSLNFSTSDRFGDLRYERKEATSQPKKVKAPNLIAKLMGLEEVPSNRVELVKNEHEKKSKAMKLQLIDQHPDQKQKTLKDIIETMQTKGVLKSRQIEDQRIRSRSSSTSQSERYDTRVLKDDEAPPIVIMKPLHLPCWERGEVQKDFLSGKASRQEEIRSVESKHEKKVSDHDRKEVKRIEKSKIELFEKASTRATEFPKQHRKAATATCKKTGEEQKPPLKGKKQEEKKVVKDVRAAKPDRRSPVVKNYVPQERILNFPVKPASQSSTDASRERKTLGAKSVRKSTPTKAANNNKSEDGEANHSLRTSGVVSATNTVSTDELLKQEEQEHIPCNKDPISKDPKIFFEVMPKTSRSEKRSDEAGVNVQLAGNLPTITKSAGIEDDLKSLLLSSKSFLGLARELFGLDAHQPTYHRRKVPNVVIARNTKLFVDCGKELLARKSRQLEISNHPILQSLVTVYTSLDQLVEEISNGIEELISYIVADGNAISEASLYIRLERDLRSKEMVTSVMWDIGWRNWICVEESEQVAAEVELHILSALVEEIVVDLVC